MTPRPWVCRVTMHQRAWGHARSVNPTLASQFLINLVSEVSRAPVASKLYHQSRRTAQIRFKARCVGSVSVFIRAIRGQNSESWSLAPYPTSVYIRVYPWLKKTPSRQRHRSLPATASLHSG